MKQSEGLKLGQDKEDCLNEDWVSLSGYRLRVGKNKAKAWLSGRQYVVKGDADAFLRETSARVRAGGLVAVSDVALLKRLRRCGVWFHG